MMDENKVLMTGNQAIARGFYEAGGQVASSYPGSPTVDILQSVKDNYKAEIYSEFSVNEKVALEVAIGASFSGARAMVSMKHVGVNIAADPMMTFTQSGTNGGFLLVTGDDPGMASSQNEQDNRIMGKFANMAILDPSDSQEAKEFTKLALKVSEENSTPVMLRITSRLCHSRSAVELCERFEPEPDGFEKDKSNFNMIPPNTFEKQHSMKSRIEKLQQKAVNMDINIFEESKNKDFLIITSGIVYNNIKELGLDIPIYKLGMIYPLPIDKIRELSSEYKNIIVIEEMTPFIENELKINGISCEGKKYFSFTGELGIEEIEMGLKEAGVVKEVKYALKKNDHAVPRLPMFCAGCPHRPVFDILKKSGKTVVGDIGCYSLAAIFPLEVLDVEISMGSSLGIMKGIAKANALRGKAEPIVAVIGDGTFFHSGMTGMVNMLHQIDPKDNMTIIILNNGTTAMTGGQHTASSGSYSKEDDMNVDMRKLLEGMGFDRVKIVDQFKYKSAKETIEAEMKHNGLSVIITTRPCALKFKVKEPQFYVDPQVCIGCRKCVKTNCPPIQMKKYEGIEKLKSSINPDMCVGCSVCAQVCPVNAIKRSK
ncbi:indolepyruvate ferredoxin oxidoreductase alpha subunit [Peptoclostridium litorale DSM 5388]|uniref:Indolepyruvate oxidoreductase subunit IorA n=1 Tax=Peptoclostridium litorale DSM 5388 TaxID=1121324 RepID=A0A069RIQ6_PEPLI|nr:indolepyruvate ferredoxin oxidoreductase subunit alpha [Peptoclostridium litorale]KDR96658.1 indolepyruvate oxidoreductase subunit IorA [Peptoclostridium litorale DSM 5388]SIN67995.1 indolepyruvate ferredoxin oxidoreductase alpha subunit [Peptoclostridium litorale DSM 5388]